VPLHGFQPQTGFSSSAQEAHGYGKEVEDIVPNPMPGLNYTIYW